MSFPAIQIRYESVFKTLSVAGAFAAGDSGVAVVLSPAILGTQVVSLKLANTELAQDEITDGAGVLDLATSALMRLFAGTPLNHCVSVEISVSDTAVGLLGSGRVILENTAEGFNVLRVAAAGQLTGILAEPLVAGTPFRRTQEGLVYGCKAETAADYLGILKTGGLAGASVKGVTAGIVQIPAWGLTAGAWYYIGRNSAGITTSAPDGYNVRRVGYAFDAVTLILTDGAVVDTGAGDYLVYDAPARGFKSVAAVSVSAGASDAGKIVKLGAGGKLDTSVMPDMTQFAVAAVGEAFAGKSALSADPTGFEILAHVKMIFETLRTLGG